MPVYQCYSPKGLLTASAKAKIADEMTNMYCNVTGSTGVMGQSSVPRAARRRVLLGRQTGTQSLILAINRHGRGPRNAGGQCCVSSRRSGHGNSGQPEADLWISVTEIDPTNVMDAGLFIAAPGWRRRTMNGLRKTARSWPNWASRPHDFEKQQETGRRHDSIR